MFVVVARYTAKAGEEAAVEEVLRELTPLSLAEPGCLVYRPHRSTEDPADFLLYEGYVDANAYDRHTRTDHFRDYVLSRAVPRLRSRERYFFESLE